MKSHPICFSSGFGNKFIIYTGKHVPHVSSQDLPVFSVKVFPVLIEDPDLNIS